jgi:hypothetical protein
LIIKKNGEFRLAVQNYTYHDLRDLRSIARILHPELLTQTGRRNKKKLTENAQLYDQEVGSMKLQT